MISLRAVKVRDSLRNWGYIVSSRCASCPRVETIDHCFLNCHRGKNVWRFFLPLLSSLLGHPFFPNCASVFFYQFQVPQQKKMRLLLFFIKTILYAIWKFRNKATFHHGKEDFRAIILIEKHRLSPTTFQDLWTHPSLCSLREHDNLVFHF